MGDPEVKMNPPTLTALVSGFPPGLRRPKPLPGENLGQLVIRNHPQQWQNCVERLKRSFHTPEEVCVRLRRGETGVALDPAAEREVERFMNLRLPAHGRTLQGLADIRQQMLGPAFIHLWRFELSEILWLRLKGPSGDGQAESFAESLGVKCLAMEKPGPADMEAISDRVHGDYLWILPGGTQLPALIALALIRVLRGFEEKPKLAMYSDRCYSQVYRTAALRTLTAAGATLSAESRDNARMLQEAGFELSVENEGGYCLAELESLYGGKNDPSGAMRPTKPDAAPKERKSWLQRLLGLG